MKKSELLLWTLIGLAVGCSAGLGVGWGAGVYVGQARSPAQPFCIEGAQKVVAALRPLAQHPYDTYVYLLGDGEVRVSVKTNGSELLGRGPTLKSAVADLSRTSDATKAALAGLPQ